MRYRWPVFEAALPIIEPRCVGSMVPGQGIEVTVAIQIAQRHAQRPRITQVLSAVLETAVPVIEPHSVAPRIADEGIYVPVTVHVA